MSSTDFIAGSPIPAANTCDGADRSLQVAWSAMPQGTRSIAVVLDDPDAGGFTHWLLFDVTPQAESIPEGQSPGVVGTNDFDVAAYRGPCPPRGSLHHYRLTVFGLDTTLPPEPEMTRAKFDREISGHILAQGQILGTYTH